MTRLFVAIDLPEECKDQLDGLCHGLPGAKWMRDQQFHVTLRFVGEVDGPMARRLAIALNGVRADPFELELQGVGTFPPHRTPRVLWAGVSVSPELTGLYQQVQRVLRRAGLPPEQRKFSPHVTLARLNGVPPQQLQGFLSEHVGLRSEPIAVTDVQLFSSALGSGGAQHRVEASYPLFARRPG
jgi:2'-5' RNA ligase